MKPTSSSNHIAVIGGGIAGLTAAIALRKRGLNPVIFEAAPDIKALGAGLVLAANAIRGLERLGIADKVVPAGQVLDRFAILDQHGKVISQADNRALAARYGVNNFAIHRVDLHRILLAQLGDIAVRTGKKAISCTQTPEAVHLQFQDGSTYDAAAVVVADGIHSAIRRQLVPGSAPRYAGYTCWRAVIQNPGLHINYSTETWGPAGRMGIVPLINNQIYWFLCLNAPAQDPAMRAMTCNDLLERLQDYHSPIPELLQATRNEQLLWNDIIDLKPISRLAYGRVLLIGDAGHATTPNMGQGACQAIEDASVLYDQLGKTPEAEPEALFQMIEKRRLNRVHTIVNRSWQIGKIAQWENPVAISLRNSLFRLVPESANEKQLEMLYQVDF